MLYTEDKDSLCRIVEIRNQTSFEYPSLLILAVPRRNPLYFLSDILEVPFPVYGHFLPPFVSYHVVGKLQVAPWLPILSLGIWIPIAS